MHKDLLSFHLTPADRKTFYDTDAFSQAFIHSLGLKVHGGCWAVVELDFPVIDTFIERAGALISSGEAQFYGYCTLSQRLVDDHETQAEWYELEWPATQMLIQVL